MCICLVRLLCVVIISIVRLLLCWCSCCSMLWLFSCGSFRFSISSVYCVEFSVVLVCVLLLMWLIMCFCWCSEVYRFEVMFGLFLVIRMCMCGGFCNG